jgi:putative transposase
MSAVRDLSNLVGTARASDVLAIPRASYYRWRAAEPPAPRARLGPPRALSPQERQAVLETLNSEEFSDKTPAEVYASLLDSSRYLCSIRTMYRILEENGEVRERRDQLRHPSYQKPELLATGPNQVWSWDITKLLGPVKWTYFYLYVILDIFSRYVVGWMVARRESASLGARLLEETIEKQGIPAGQLAVHSDRGPSMSSKSVALLLADLGVTKTHSRPHVCDDNPFSEAQFKTLKYRPEFPKRFGSLEDARAFCQSFFPWYNWEHHHTALGLLTPGVVHCGKAEEVIKRRQRVLEVAYRAHPERFVRREPVPPQIPREVWINPPEPRSGLEGAGKESSRKTTPLAAPTIDDRGSTRSKLPPGGATFCDLWKTAGAWGGSAPASREATEPTRTAVGEARLEHDLPLVGGQTPLRGTHQPPLPSPGKEAVKRLELVH